jgi:hypothetical protein
MVDLECQYEALKVLGDGGAGSEALLDLVGQPRLEFKIEVVLFQAALLLVLAVVVVPELTAHESDLEQIVD